MTGCYYSFLNSSLEPQTPSNPRPPPTPDPLQPQTPSNPRPPPTPDPLQPQTPANPPKRDLGSRLPKQSPVYLRSHSIQCVIESCCPVLVYEMMTKDSSILCSSTTARQEGTDQLTLHCTEPGGGPVQQSAQSSQGTNKQGPW